MNARVEEAGSAEDRFAALDRLLDAGEAQAADMLALARKSRRQHVDVELVCRMYFRACRAATNDESQVALARVAANEALVLARQAHRPELVASARIKLLTIDMNTGDHRDAFDGLLALATSPQSRTLPPLVRTHLFLQLALACTTADLGDSVSLCLQMAEATETSAHTPLPLHQAVWIETIRFMQALVSYPVFDKSMRPFTLDDAQRRLLLQRTVQRLSPRAHEVDASSGLWVRHQLLCTLPLAQALLSGDVADLDTAWQRYQALMADQPREEEQGLYRMACCYLLLDHPQQALAMINQVMAEDPGNLWQERLQWLYLRYAVSRACGLAQDAVHWYERYLQMAVEVTPRIEFNTARLLRRLSGLQEREPINNGFVFRPKYLDRAVQLLRSDEPPAQIASLAKAVGVSERVLRSAFVTHLGMAPKQFAVACRLDAARRELEAGSIRTPVSDLAERYGFSHAGRFTAAYRKRFGHSPVVDANG